MGCSFGMTTLRHDHDPRAEPRCDRETDRPAADVFIAMIAGATAVAFVVADDAETETKQVGVSVSTVFAVAFGISSLVGHRRAETCDAAMKAWERRRLARDDPRG